MSPWKGSKFLNINILSHHLLKNLCWFFFFLFLSQTQFCKTGVKTENQQVISSPCDQEGDSQSLTFVFCYLLSREDPGTTAREDRKPVHLTLLPAAWLTDPSSAFTCHKHMQNLPCTRQEPTSPSSPSGQWHAPTPDRQPGDRPRSVCASHPMLSRIQVRHASPSVCKSRRHWTVLVWYGLHMWNRQKGVIQDAQK